MPTISFDGFDDGYVRDILNGNVEGGNFNDAINAGYIESGSSFEDKIAARRAYFLQGEHARSLCDVNQTIFGRRGLPQLIIWDYFKAKRTRNFQSYGWKNGNWAWEIYDKEETNLDHYQNYKGLANKTVTETIPVYDTITKNKLDANGQAIPLLNDDGTPKTNSDGTIIYETVTEQVFSHNEVMTRKVNAAELKKLRQMYKEAFTDSYNIYFAKQYASIEYHVKDLPNTTKPKL